MNCKDCHYWEFWEGRDAGAPSIGTCRRFPPPRSASTFVSTAAADWCGEWKGIDVLEFVEAVKRGVGRPRK